MIAFFFNLSCIVHNHSHPQESVLESLDTLFSLHARVGEIIMKVDAFLTNALFVKFLMTYHTLTSLFRHFFSSLTYFEFLSLPADIFSPIMILLA